jgi:hypothetical protein
MQNQGAVVVASLMIIVLSFMFYLFSNVLNFFIIGIGMGLFIIITGMFFMLTEIRDAMIEMSDVLEIDNVLLEAPGRSIALKIQENKGESKTSETAKEPVNAEPESPRNEAD